MPPSFYYLPWDHYEPGRWIHPDEYNYSATPWAAPPGGIRPVMPPKPPRSLPRLTFARLANTFLVRKQSLRRVARADKNMRTGIAARRHRTRLGRRREARLSGHGFHREVPYCNRCGGDRARTQRCAGVDLRRRGGAHAG